MDEEIRELFARTQRTRLQFLKAELQTCRTALGMGTYQLSVGNVPMAEHEATMAQKCIREIDRYLPSLPPDRMQQIEPGLAEVRAMLDSLKADLKKAPPERS